MNIKLPLKEDLMLKYYGCLWTTHEKNLTFLSISGSHCCVSCCYLLQAKKRSLG